MDSLSVPAVLQILVGLTLLNVWLLRAGRSTPYRGGGATSLKEEFAAYGLPDSARLVVGGLKVIAGVVLLAGLWWPLPVRAAAAVVAALMCGAIAMHVKIKDAPMKSLPAAVLLVMSMGIVALR